jgi:hypothetical protein
MFMLFECARTCVARMRGGAGTVRYPEFLYEGQPALQAGPIEATLP